MSTRRLPTLTLEEEHLGNLLACKSVTADNGCWMDLLFHEFISIFQQLSCNNHLQHKQYNKFISSQMYSSLVLCSHFSDGLWNCHLQTRTTACTVMWCTDVLFLVPYARSSRHSFLLLSKIGKLKHTNYNSTHCFEVVWNTAIHIKGGMSTVGVWEHSAEVNIRT